MAPAENVMQLMKQYLSSMSKRIEDLTIRTKELEAELSRRDETQKSEIIELTGKLEKLSTDQEDTQTLLEKARDEWKKRTEDLEANLGGFASFEAVTELQNKVDKEIEILRDEKQDRADFQEFVDSTFTPLKELFAENTQAPSFADFATVHTTAAPTQTVETPEETSEESMPQTTPAPNPSEYARPPSEQKRIPQEKRKKKWL